MPDASSFALRRPGWRVWVAGALAVIVFGVLLAARIAGGDDEKSPRSGAPVASSTSDSTLEPVDPSGEPLPNDGPAGPEASHEASQRAAPAAMTVAVAFAQAWATPPPPSAPDQWWAGVSRHTDQALAEQLREVNPADLPATRVTGPAKSVAGGVTSAEVEVPTDAGDLLVVCVDVRGRWVVADFELDRGTS